VIYLASPYTHASEAVMKWRHEQVVRATAEYIREGLLIFSPIVHSQPLEKYNLGFRWDEWRNWDLHMLDLASELWVLCLDGWKESQGVQAEIRHARSKDKPVVHVWRNTER